jgi:two-component sensor histidine kinase
MMRTTDFGGYVKSLCDRLAEVQAAPDGAVTLTCLSEPLILDLDVVTALGLVVAELVTNIVFARPATPAKGYYAKVSRRAYSTRRLWISSS